MPPPRDRRTIQLDEERRRALYALLEANLAARVRRIEIMQAAQTTLLLTIAVRSFGVPIERMPAAFFQLIFG